MAFSCELLRTAPPMLNNEAGCLGTGCPVWCGVNWLTSPKKKKKTRRLAGRVCRPPYKRQQVIYDGKDAKAGTKGAHRFGNSRTAHLGDPDSRAVARCPGFILFFFFSPCSRYIYVPAVWDGIC